MDAIKTNSGLAELESDEELEAALRRELAEIARANGVNDPDVLLDILIDGTSENVSEV